MNKFSNQKEMEVKCPLCPKLVDVPVTMKEPHRILMLEASECPICEQEFNVEYVRWMPGQDN